MNEFDSVKNVNCLYVDEEGRLWIGTNDNGLAIAVGGRISNSLFSGSGLPSDSVKSIVTEKSLFMEDGSEIHITYLEKEEDGHGHKVGASSSPKCIKCINKLFINSGNIYVRGSGGGAAEGLEAKKQCEINGGKIRSYCADDALNCSGCTMNDGDVVIISSENDGLDAGNLKLFGGTIYAVGGWDAQMGIDTDGKTFEITGGEIIGVAARSCTPHGTSTQAAICFYLPKTYCSAAALADADGNIITQFPTPNTYEVLCMLVTNDRIKEGDSYKIFSYKDSIDDEPVTEYEFTMEGLFMTLGSKKSKETK